MVHRGSVNGCMITTAEGAWERAGALAEDVADEGAEGSGELALARLGCGVPDHDLVDVLVGNLQRPGRQRGQVDMIHESAQDGVAGGVTFAAAFQAGESAAAY